MNFDTNDINIKEIAFASIEDIELLTLNDFDLKRMKYSELEFEDAYKAIKTEQLSTVINEVESKDEINKASTKKSTLYKKKSSINKKSTSSKDSIKKIDEGKPIEYIRNVPITMDEAMFLPIPIKNETNILFGNNNFYCLFMYFYYIYERITKAKLLSGMFLEERMKDNIPSELKDKWNDNSAKFKKEQYEQIYLKILYSRLTGIIDVIEYEKFTRLCLGTQGHFLFTIEKCINSVCLHNIIDA